MKLEGLGGFRGKALPKAKKDAERSAIDEFTAPDKTRNPNAQAGSPAGEPPLDPLTSSKPVFKMYETRPSTQTQRYEVRLPTDAERPARAESAQSQRSTPTAPRQTQGNVKPREKTGDDALYEALFESQPTSPVASPTSTIPLPGVKPSTPTSAPRNPFTGQTRSTLDPVSGTQSVRLTPEQRTRLQENARNFAEKRDARLHAGERPPQPTRRPAASTQPTRRPAASTQPQATSTSSPSASRFSAPANPVQSQQTTVPSRFEELKAQHVRPRAASPAVSPPPRRPVLGRRLPTSDVTPPGSRSLPAGRRASPPSAYSPSNTPRVALPNARPYPRSQPHQRGAAPPPAAVPPRAAADRGLSRLKAQGRSTPQTVQSQNPLEGFTSQIREGKKHQQAMGNLFEGVTPRPATHQTATGGVRPVGSQPLDASTWRPTQAQPKPRVSPGDQTEAWLTSQQKQGSLAFNKLSAAHNPYMINRGRVLHNFLKVADSQRCTSSSAAHRAVSSWRNRLAAA